MPSWLSTSPIAIVVWSFCHDVEKKSSWLSGLFSKSFNDTEKLEKEDYSIDFSDLETLESQTQGVVDEEGGTVSRIKNIYNFCFSQYY